MPLAVCLKLRRRFRWQFLKWKYFILSSLTLVYMYTKCQFFLSFQVSVLLFLDWFRPPAVYRRTSLPSYSQHSACQGVQMRDCFTLGRHGKYIIECVVWSLANFMWVSWVYEVAMYISDMVDGLLFWLLSFDLCGKCASTNSELLAWLSVSWEATSPSIPMEGMFLVILHVLIDFKIYTLNYGTFCNTKNHKT